MKITIVGAGMVGRTLGRLVREAGHSIGEVICSTRQSAIRAARFIGAGQPQAAIPVKFGPADLILISTPDDRIGMAVQMLQRQAADIGRASVLHTSGALSSELLRPLKKTGMTVGSCHPLQTFGQAARALERLPGSYFCVEGDAPAVRAARKLIRDIGAKSFEIPTRMKPLYHAAAVMAAGNLVALLSISLEMLERCGLGEREARRVLMPLIQGAVENVGEIGAAAALTGPVRRGDIGTIEQNLKAAARHGGNTAEIYKLLALRSLQLAGDIDHHISGEIKRLLTEKKRKA